jgi:hypothetical protein
VTPFVDIVREGVSVLSLSGAAGCGAVERQSNEGRRCGQRRSLMGWLTLMARSRARTSAITTGSASYRAAEGSAQLVP